MSRTYKDRPYWVLTGDPKIRKKEIHDHLLCIRTYLGEEPVYRENMYGDKQFWYNRKLYRYTYKTVDCTLHLAETPNTYYHRWWGIEEENLPYKLCHAFLCYYPNIHSNKFAKQTTNRALRAKIRQQLKQAVLQDPEDVDIFTDSYYASRGWFE